MQEDEHVAWSSPIWVDYIPLSSLPKTPKKTIAKVAPKKTLIEEFEDEDEDDEFEDDFDE
jgi:hypothetical protein